MKKKGTTLIELLVALSSITVVLLLFIPLASKLTTTTDEAITTTSFSNIESALTRFKLDNGSLPIGTKLLEEELSSDTKNALVKKLELHFELSEDELSKAMDEIMGHLHNVDINKMEEYIQGDALLDEFFIIEEAAPYLSGCIISLKTTNFSDLDVNDIVILQENNCLSINNNEHLFDFDE